MQFTDMLIKNLKPRDAVYDFREGSGRGFGIRVFPSGRKSWLFVFHYNGKKTRMTLGAYPDIGLLDARKLHRNALSCLAMGKNPAAEQQQAKIEARTADTVDELAHEYLERWAKPRKRSWREDARILNKDILTQIGHKKAREVTRRDIISILDKVLERGAPIGANRTLEVVRRMFNFAVERDILTISPCYMVKAPSKENRRDRLLSEEEIRTFWRSLETSSMFETTKLALKLQLITGQRKGEIIKAEWSEFDLPNGWWTIPAAKAKNGILHRVPLSTLTIQILQQLKTISNGSRWLFPSPIGDAHITPIAVSRALSRAINNIPNIKSFTPHDLRRTAASHMTALGISRLVVSKLLNHVERSVTAIYDRHSYDNEKREALERWSKKLEEIVYGKTENKIIKLAIAR